jgi:microsomal dipeptidase-like Zn-dependent dipeptidase
MRLRRTIATLTAALLLPGCGLLGATTEEIARNRVISPSLPGCPDPAAEADCALGQQLFVADMHADSLLWGRDLRVATARGHADFPRLAAAGVDLQVLATPNVTPLGRPFGEHDCASGGDIDLSDLLFFANDTGEIATWTSPRARALRQAERWRTWSGPSEGAAAPRRLLTRGDIPDLEAWSQARPEPGQGPVTLLALEGLNWVHSNPAWLRRELDALTDAGFRMIALTHRFSNALAGSSEDCADRYFGRERGLSDLGRVAVEETIARGLVLDLAHASAATIAEASAAVRQAGPGARPGLVVSHAGVRRPGCDAPRNLSAEDVRHLALADGVIGIGYWAEAVCWDVEGGTAEEAVAAVVRSFLAAWAMLHAEGIADDYRATWGRPYDPVNHLALGSDFDGSVLMRFDTTAVPKIVAALRDARCEPALAVAAGAPGLCAEVERPFAAPSVLRRIAGGNLARVLARTLREAY